MRGMARALRIEYPGAVYHVVARGNQKQRICVEDGDRKLWRATLGDACERTGWRVHAWVLMDNHYHLLLETPEANLVNGMKWLQGTYTQRYNARHRQCGHLFQGRYRAIPVAADDAEYLPVVSTYIHLNPARARLIRVGEQKLWEYRWSSYPAFVHRGEVAPEWLVTQRVLASLGFRPGDSKGYETYLETRVLELGSKDDRREWEAQWRELRRGWYLGKDPFRLELLDRMKGVLSGHRRESYAGLEKQEHGEEHAEGRLGKGLKILRLSAQDLASMPKGQLEKKVLAWWLCQHTTVTRRWVSERLGMGHVSRITQALREVREGQESPLAELKDKLSRLAS
jgi:putative transposase